MEKTFLNNFSFKVNEEKRTVTCCLKSKGQKFYAISKCFEDDVFDIEKGKQIAAYRVEIMQRKRDLKNTKRVIGKIKEIMEYEEAYLDKWKLSKHWDNFLRLACEEEKKQEENIRFCKNELEKLTELKKHLKKLKEMGKDGNDKTENHLPKIMYLGEGGPVSSMKDSDDEDGDDEDYDGSGELGFCRK